MNLQDELGITFIVVTHDQEEAMTLASRIAVMNHGRLEQVGTPGEILVRGPMVFQGYFRLDEVTEYTFRNGWHHTGDVGRFDEDESAVFVAFTPLLRPTMNSIRATCFHI